MTPVLRFLLWVLAFDALAAGLTALVVAGIGSGVVR
jgi:hypothetical protein